MVSKNYTTLSLLMPVAMTIGTLFAIYAYEQSNQLLTMMIYIFGFLIICIFIVVTVQSSKRKNR
jgi:hypothetical protein